MKRALALVALAAQTACALGTTPTYYVMTVPVYATPDGPTEQCVRAWLAWMDKHSMCEFPKNTYRLNVIAFTDEIECGDKPANGCYQASAIGGVLSVRWFSGKGLFDTAATHELNHHYQHMNYGAGWHADDVQQCEARQAKVIRKELAGVCK